MRDLKAVTIIALTILTPNASEGFCLTAAGLDSSTMTLDDYIRNFVMNARSTCLGKRPASAIRVLGSFL